jgi:cytidine deaminase
LFYASSKFPGIKIKAIGISSVASDHLLITPCGACRQAMLEYEINGGAPIVLILRYGENQALLINSVSDLLPLAFTKNSLEMSGRKARKQT